MNRKPFQELEFRDAFMFAEVMSDPEICRSVLERVLGIPIKKVVVHAEHSILVNPDQRGVRLDVYADNQEGTVYNVEMQTTDHKNVPKRSRCYQGQMDVAYLEPGDDFNHLPESLVIFICTFDPCGRNRYRYTFRERCEEDGELLGDGTCKVFLNTKGTNAHEVPEELVRFLSYVDNPKSVSEQKSDPLVEIVKKQIAKIKRNRRMEDKYMKFEELLRDERREGKVEGIREGQANMLKLIGLMCDNGQASEIPRLGEELEFLKAMLEKYNIEEQI